MPTYTADWQGPGTEFWVTHAVAFIDSLVLFCALPVPKNLIGSLRNVYGTRVILKSYKDRTRKRGKVWFLTVHQPKRSTLTYLRTMQGLFVIHEVHLAVDFICPDQRQAASATEFLKRRVLQKWRAPGTQSHLIANTAYWKSAKAAQRNIALYGDRPSKTGPAHCCHFEMRFKGATACKRAGLGELGDLIQGIDVMECLEHQTRIKFIDPKRLNTKIDKRIRQIVFNGQRRGKRIHTAYEKSRLLIYLERALADDDEHVFGQTCDSIARVRSQCLWDMQPRYRSCLVRIPWSQFTPLPRWHHWR